MQLQIHQNRDLTRILFASDQETELESITLNPGFEYTIKLFPRGRRSKSRFQQLSLQQRKCRLDHEILDDSTTKIYTKLNCKYDCHISLAIDSCGCIPWDFLTSKENVQECDIFSRKCFFNKMENLTHDPRNFCPRCIDECDKIEFRKEIVEEKSLELKKANDEVLFCNGYVCMDIKGYIYFSDKVCV